MEADLLRAGWTVQDIPGRLPWTAVIALAENAGPGTALWTVERGALAPWGVTEHLLRQLIDATRVLVWQNTADAQPDPRTKVAPAKHYPEPTWWPGSGRPPPDAGHQVTPRSIGGPERVDLDKDAPSTRTDIDRKIAAETKMTLAEADAWLGWTD